MSNKERRAPAPETPATPEGAEEAQALDVQSSTGEEYALVVSDVKLAIERVQDTTQPIERRALWYAGLRRLKLQIDRSLRAPGRELQSAMGNLVEGRPERVQYGPLRLTWKPINVRWPVNDRGNWQDDGVQELLKAWAPTLNDGTGDEPIIRHVPDHLEVDTKALAAALQLGRADARHFHRLLKDQKLRTEEGRSATIELVE